MQCASSLIATIRKKLPEFAKAGADDSELVLLHQDAFAADYQEDEYALLGMAQLTATSAPTLARAIATAVPISLEPTLYRPNNTTRTRNSQARQRYQLQLHPNDD